MNGYPNPRGQYFKNLCERLFDYQEKHGLIEPHVDFFLPVLFGSRDVSRLISDKGIDFDQLQYSLNSTLILREMTTGNVAFFDDEKKFHPAGKPEETSLSAIYQAEADIKYQDKAAREANFHEYLAHGPSQSVTKLIEECLWEMETKNIPMTDIGLFETMLSSPDYKSISESVRKILRNFGITSEISSDGKSAKTVTFPDNALYHFGV